KPHMPRSANKEYRELAARSETGWGNLIVTAVSQTLFCDGYRRSDAPDDARPWRFWHANGMAARQNAIFEGALGHGLSYATVLPGEDFTGQEIPLIRGVSAREGIAMFDDPAQDDLPEYFMRCKPTNKRGDKGWALTLLDDEVVWKINCRGNGEQFGQAAIDAEHGLGFTPAIRFANKLDLEGRSPGEIEPHIPLLARLNQNTFDRLVVQRFAAWVVRYITGMSLEETVEVTGETREQVKMRLSAESLLTVSDPNARVGSLPASPLDGLISSDEHDAKQLSAVTQTSATEIMGTPANLSADAIAELRAGPSAKRDQRQTSFGESINLTLRVAALVDGDKESAQDVAASVLWRDTSIRSLSQAADALGKLATMLGVPPEMLWEKIPGWTQTDVERAKAITKDGGGVNAVIRQILTGGLPPVGNAA
ncbi:MAG: phage portal protein, partial [Acidimicrobiales bacterium]|nr:phage portal protein [Acidimicrobiales bacterium]